MKIFRGPILNPRSEDRALLYKNGALVVNDNGCIQEVGRFNKVMSGLVNRSRAKVQEVSDGLIVPAFVDAHVHMPQNHVKGAFEGELLPWLQNSIWPEEAKFSDHEFADDKARQFFRDMAGQGTLLSMVFSSIHENALDSIFQHKIGHTIAGNVLMDQNSPNELQQPTEEAIQLAQKMVQTYGDDYALTPRFAPTCSAELMAALSVIAGRARAFIQTHLSENKDEIVWVKQLFPNSDSYTDVYRSLGLLGTKTVMAHAIHMSDAEWAMLKDSNAKVAHCPTSNEALYSGVMPLGKLREFGVEWALGSDVGAGPSLSMLHVMQSALNTHNSSTSMRPVLTEQEAFYRATLAGAKILGRDNVMGNFSKGNEANFVILDTNGRPNNVIDAVRRMTTGTQAQLENKVRGVYLRGEQLFVDETDEVAEAS